MLQPEKSSSTNGPRKVLNAPIHLASMTNHVHETEDLKSIWLQTRDDSLVSNNNCPYNPIYKSSTVLTFPFYECFKIP